MITRKELYDLYRSRKPILNIHDKNSANTLSRLSKELDRRDLDYKLDPEWIYHLLVFIDGKILRVYSRACDKGVEVVCIYPNAIGVIRQSPRIFFTAQGTVNYILKRFGQKEIV